MQKYEDPTLGTIVVKRYSLSSGLKFKISPKGEVNVSAPKSTPLFFIKRAVSSERRALSEMLNKHRSTADYTRDQTIGKSHQIIIEINAAQSEKVELKGRTILVRLSQAEDIMKNDIQKRIQSLVIKVLKKEASAYLTRRIAVLAQRNGFSYKKLRFSHSGTRWGSCSSSGTVSLNIALMKLPLELIDYVIIHELCHTVEMNHSSSFWKLVRTSDPNYLKHKKDLSAHNPAL